MLGPGVAGAVEVVVPQVEGLTGEDGLAAAGTPGEACGDERLEGTTELLVPTAVPSSARFPTYLRVTHLSPFSRLNTQQSARGEIEMTGGVWPSVS